MHFNNKLLCIALTVFALSYTNNCMSKDVVIFWDIDNVVSKRVGSIPWPSYKELWNKNVSFQKNMTFIGKILANLSHLVTTGNEGLSEQFLHLAMQHNKDAAAYIYKAVNGPKQPIKGTVAIMQQLHALGIKQYAGSNMGETIFKNLTEQPRFKFLKECLNLDKSQNVTLNSLKDKNYKPHAPFYKTFLKNNELTASQVIFIDDKLKNVAAAKKVGMHAILFKNPVQLKDDLNKLLHKQFSLNLKID